MKGTLGDVPDPGDRYTIGEFLGKGVYGMVYNAFDNQASKKKVAIKIQKYDKETREHVEEEFAILRDFSHIIYLIDFYGIFKRDNEIWFVLENCEGHTAIDLVRGLLDKNRRISEEHIAYILKEVVKAIIYLHEHNIIHRDIKASNILLTTNGEVKLCDFGMSKVLKDKDQKLAEVVGSPCWMAPELVAANPDDDDLHYDNRVDVWALGITALELGEGEAPFQNMHPTRALFQIVRNPPPTLKKVAFWSENYKDFINECLIKYYEHRPYIMEIIDHPFLGEIPENNYHLTLEIKKLIEDIGPPDVSTRPQEMAVNGKFLKKSIDDKLEIMWEEDLTDITNIGENNVLELLEERTKKGEYYNFVGDILLFINPNEKLKIFGDKHHHKYCGKSRSDNAPHIYAVADTAYQNAIHHNIPQQILLTGESGSGKTTNFLHLIDHLFYIKPNIPISTERIKNGIKLIHALTHSSTPANDYSTRCVLKTSVSYGPTGKLTGASFKSICLEKWRVSAVDMNQSNFHIFYYIYDGLVKIDATEKYKLDTSRNYRYLRIPRNEEECHTKKPRDNVEQNVIKYKKIFSYLEEFEFSEEQINTFFSVLAAILNLGEIRFTENDDGSADIENRQYAENFAELMELDEKKFCWALTNYCLVRKGSVLKRKNTTDEARDARDVLANNMYIRFVDFIISLVNDKLQIGKSIFGEKYTIKILDYFGFECFKKNYLPQFFVNCLNEQLQYHYLQRIFAWEMQDLQAEELESEPYQYFDNRKTLNQLLSKPEGVLCIIDDAARKNLGPKYVIDNIQSQETSRVTITGNSEFSVAHYTGVVAYSVSEMPNKNRDFLPPELIETLRDSENPIVRLMFVNKLDKTGNLCVNFERGRRMKNGASDRRGTNPDQFSQIKRMRTAGTVFRSLCLDLLKELSVGSGSGGTHFVRCVRSDLKGRPDSFHKELVRQQLRALAVVETAKARQRGYPHRIGFSEFLRRYKFLAFDFDETVDMTKENCRLLLIRLNMEGWAIGKNKVFLKYHNEEYLSRLYETQVKKIVKIQSILRGFLIKCRLKKEQKEIKKDCIDEINKSVSRRGSVMTPDEAAQVIQKAYRRQNQKQYSKDPFAPLTDADCKFILPYAKKWKASSIFQVLLQYRATKMHEFFNFAQQVHFSNQEVYFQLQQIQKPVDIRYIDKKANVVNWLGEKRPPVMKTRFRLDEIPYYDTSCMCDPLTNIGGFSEYEPWDSPYLWRENVHEESPYEKTKTVQKTTPRTSSDTITNIPYNRDPDEALTSLPDVEKDADSSRKTHKQSQNLATARKYQTFEDSNKQQSQNYSSVQLGKTTYTKPKAIERENYTFNSAPANKDFEYVKASPLLSKPKNADPIAELRNMAKRRDSQNDDEPPFNFQGMLRKTNFQRDSMKKTFEAVRRFSLTKDKEMEDRKERLTNGESAYNKAVVMNSRPVTMELVPGLIIEGIEVDL